MFRKGRNKKACSMCMCPLTMTGGGYIIKKLIQQGESNVYS